MTVAMAHLGNAADVATAAKSGALHSACSTLDFVMRVAVWG